MFGFAYAREVFKDDGVQVGGVYELFGDTVVEIRHEPLFSSAHCPEASFGGASAFLLEFGPGVLVSASNGPYLRGSVFTSFTGDSDSVEPPVHS